ncbi:MAG: polyketide synthase, partial [Desulfobacterales bacterium]|nr:polyketide synthase [Desulfobacterales bacterium]
MSSELNSKRNDIAIIGMACRFPGADDHAAFWKNLEKGECSIQEVPPERWDAERYYSPDPDAPNKSVSKWYGVIRGADRFDNRFFNIPPGEARYMDPQQRLLLEEAWHCIEDAGVPLGELRDKRTDVYVGTADWDYILNTLSADVNIHTVLGNHSSLLANRISYMLGFSGTSLTLDTACSSSLFAAEKACEALSSESAEYALVASACVHSHPLKYIAFSKAHIVSPDGRCKTFDRDADGFVLGDGVGVLLLQRLGDALREKKHIYGVIKGVATNHGGSGVTLTSPSTTAQAEVLTAAYEKAGLTPDAVDYIEAHGTGTLIGDPIEIEALTKVFRQHTDERQVCSIGSVKTNIGHTGGSAGMAGIIKVLSMMGAGKIPPSLHFNTPNPVIDFEDSPFRVATELRPWKAEHPVYAGVSAFGFGGANAHVVVASPPQVPAPETTGNSGVFMLSAKSEESLLALLDNWKQFTDSDTFTRIAFDDMCKTLATGRESFSWRWGCVANNEKELRRLLKTAREELTEPASPKLCLRIGPSEWQGWEDVAPLLSVNNRFENKLEDVLEALGKFDKKGAKLRGLRRKKWTANHNLYRFVTGYAFLNSFLDTAGIIPDLLAGDTQTNGKKTAANKPDNFFTALTLSGALSLDDALGLLFGGLKPAEIVLSRPDIPFFDPVAQEIISPSRVTADDLKTLVKH